jgi:serine/threonine-protein kinase
LEIGRIIDGRYVVERTIASGGMATVYVVRHTSLDSQHALKILHVPSPEIRERLLQEGRLQARLRHPNIVAVTDTLTIDGAPGLVMEYIDGPSLDDWLAKNRPSVEEAERLFLGVLAAVDHAHRHGVVHRDLKPANVLLAPMSGGYLPKVADFGIAKVVADVLDDKGAGRVKTRSGVAMGTPAYMAPEQMESAAKVGPAADVFALGCILYDLMIGKPAFDGPHLVSILTKSREGLYDDPADVRPELPERVVEAIRGALVPEVEDRITTVAELARVLTDGKIQTLTGLSGPVEPEGTDRGQAGTTRYPRGLGSDALRSKDTFRGDDLPANAQKNAGRRPDRVPEGPELPAPLEATDPPQNGRLWLGILVPLLSLLIVISLGAVLIVGLGGAAGAAYWWTVGGVPQNIQDPPIAPEPVTPIVKAPIDPVQGNPVLPPADAPPVPPRPDPARPDPARPDPARPDPAKPDPTRPDPVSSPPTPVVPPQPPEPKPTPPAPLDPKPTAEPKPVEVKPTEPKPAIAQPPSTKPNAWALTVHQASTKSEVRNGVFRYASGQDRALLVVDVSVANGTTDRSEPTAPFRLVRDGSSYEAHLACTLAVPGAIASGTEYPAGGTVRGSVCFEVPASGSGGEIRFYPKLGGASAANARVPR